MKIKKECLICKKEYFVKQSKNYSKYCSNLCRYTSFRGRLSWSKGLTKETDPRVNKFSESLKKYYKENPNPKCGFKKGVKMHICRKLTDEHKRKIGIGVKSSKRWQDALKSEERRIKLSGALKGRKLDENWREKNFFIKNRSIIG